MDANYVMVILLIIAFVAGSVWYFRKEGYEDVDYTQPITNQTQKLVPEDKDASAFIDQIDEIDLSEDLLITGNNININTVQTSKKNPNLQLRADPPVPIVETGPFNQSTIVPHYQKTALGE